MAASGNPVSSLREARRSPDALRETMRDAARYRQLAALCSDGVLLIKRGRIADANPAALHLLNHGDLVQLAGRPLSDFLDPNDPIDAQKRMQQAIDVNDGHASFERRLRRPDGTTLDVEITVAYCQDPAEHDTCLVVMHAAPTPPAMDSPSLPDQHLRLITDAVPALIAYVDADERYRFVNAAYEEWFMRPRADIIGRSLSEVLGPIYSLLHSHVADVLAGHQVHYEATIPTVRGMRHAMSTYTPDIGKNGKVRGFSAMVMDITTRKKGEQSLRERERQLRLITDAVPVLIAQIDKDCRLRFLNKTYADRFGYRPRDVLGRRIPEILGERVFATIRPHIDAALAGKPQEHEVKVPSGDAGERYLQMMYVPEKDERGEVRGLVAAVSDVTRLRHAEETLERRQREFKTLVENSSDIITRIDRDMRHLYANPAIEALAGIPSGTYIGKTKAELGLPADVVKAWDTAARAAFDSSVEQKLDFDHNIDGRMRFFSGRIIPEMDSDGRVESVVGIAYDVTERARMEKERDELLARERAARIQAETAARARDEFLAIVSHELRAPLNGIQSWAHVLENYVKDAVSAPLAQRALQGIKTGVGQQVRLIEDLLDVTRMMSGKLRLVKQPLAILPVIQAAVESVRSMAAAKHIGITCTYRITSEQTDGDSDRVQQIFWNLLTNAVKFTPENGNVWLTASHVDDRICVTIRDDGVGISPDFLPLLFNRFSQEDTSSTRDHSGLGLGLFLVRHLIELHGGSVHAESEGEGQGATFSVCLPLRAPSVSYIPALRMAEPVEDVPLPSLDGLCVLLIDDQQEARESLTVVLHSAGANVFAAKSAKEALAWLPTLGGDEYPDVLVCDIAMPGEDGYAVLRKIRTWKAGDGSKPLHRLPALALTAFAQREDRIRALTAGFQMHVTKPAAPEELIVVIDTMVPRDR